MYAYASGSPATYGCETNGRLSGIGGGPTVYMRGPGFGCPGIMQRGGLLGLGVEAAPAAPAAPAASGGGWADVIGATVGGLASIFQLSTQQKMATEARHSAERTAALNAQTAATQATYFPQVVGAQAAATSGGGMGTTVLVVGGLAAVGVGAWLLLRRRRR